MPDLLIEHPPGYEAERRYIHKVILGEFLGLTFAARPAQRADVCIRAESGCGELTLPDQLFQTPSPQWLTRASLPRLPLPSIDSPNCEGERAIPVIYGTGGPAISRSGNAIKLSIDVFGSAFFMLTRYEEAITGGPRDEHGSFPDEAALAVRERFAHRPIVNEYAALLERALQLLWPGLPRAKRSFRVLLTHDVDWPLATAGRLWPRVARQMVIDTLQRHNLQGAAMRLHSYRRTRAGDDDADMWNTFDFIMSSAEEAGLRAAFYLIPERLAGKLDGSCAINHPFIRRLIRQIDARGHELGLHTSYEAHRDPALIARQLAQLRAVLNAEGVEQQILGGRQHYLRWLNPETWQGWDSAGLSYDSSVGYVRHTGFRAGTCFEYPVFNLRRRQPLRLRERPLVAMEEAALIEHAYRYERVAEGIIGLSRTVRRFGGDFVLLWHNNWLAQDVERLCFRSVLAEISGGRGW